MMETTQELKNEKQEVDRISSLPEHLQHSVMFKLCKRDATKMCPVSKGWYRVWMRFPVIDIDEADYKSRERFIQALRLHLQRHNFDGLQELSLQTVKPMIEEIYQLVNHFIDAAILGCLQKLHLKFYDNGSQEMYIVPEIVFSGGSALTSLRVAGCDIQSYNILNLHQLRTLKLREVQIEDDLIQRLMQSCPLLESFSLEYYHELRGIKIIHERIKKFTLSVDEDLEELEIHLPKLQSFKFKGYYSFEEGYMAASKFGILSTLGEYKVQSFYLKYTMLEAQTFQSLQLKHVRRLLLHYIDVESDDLWFTGGNFPFLQFLSLKGCNGLEEVYVISSTLESFIMEDCIDMKYCRTVALNLRFFKYLGPVIIFSQTGFEFGRLQVNLTFEQPVDHEHDLLQSLRLRNFMQAFRGAKEIAVKLEGNCQECLKMFRAVTSLV